jgi:hypothetical protein
MHPPEEYRRRAERAERALESARDPEAKRLLREVAQRWRQLAEFALAVPPIPARFSDASEAVHYAQEHGFALYWKGTSAFAKRQGERGDRFVTRPVFTRKGVTYVGLVSLEQEKASGEEPP